MFPRTLDDSLKKINEGLDFIESLPKDKKSKSVQKTGYKIVFLSAEVCSALSTLDKVLITINASLNSTVGKSPSDYVATLSDDLASVHSWIVILAKMSTLSEGHQKWLGVQPRELKRLHLHVKNVQEKMYTLIGTVIKSNKHPLATSSAIEDTLIKANVVNKSDGIEAAPSFLEMWPRSASITKKAELSAANEEGNELKKSVKIKV